MPALSNDCAVRATGQKTDHHGAPHARRVSAQQRCELALGAAPAEPGDHVHDPEIVPCYAHLTNLETRGEPE